MHYLYYIAPLYNFTAGHRSIASHALAGMTLVAANAAQQMWVVPVFSTGMMNSIVDGLRQRLADGSTATLVLDYPAHAVLKRLSISDAWADPTTRERVKVVYLTMYHTYWPGVFEDTIKLVDVVVDLEPLAHLTLPTEAPKRVDFVSPWIRPVPKPTSRDIAIAQNHPTITYATGNELEGHYLRTGGVAGRAAVRPAAADLGFSDSRVALRIAQSILMSGGYSTSWELWALGLERWRTALFQRLSRPVENIDLRLAILSQAAGRDVSAELPNASEVAAAQLQRALRLAWGESFDVDGVNYWRDVVPIISLAKPTNGARSWWLLLNQSAREAIAQYKLQTQETKEVPIYDRNTDKRSGHAADSVGATSGAGSR